jgi:hypothetical protein
LNEFLAIADRTDDTKGAAEDPTMKPRISSLSAAMMTLDCLKFLRYSPEKAFQENTRRGGTGVIALEQGQAKLYCPQG